jgi:hypothetical protein
MKKLLNAEYLFSAETPTGLITVSVYIYYDLGKYSINEPCQEGVFWGDRNDIVEDSIKAKLIHKEIIPFIAHQFDLAANENSN